MVTFVNYAERWRLELGQTKLVATRLIDASMIQDWLNCREYFRYKWIENIVPETPNIHQAFGKAVHLAVEMFWRGGSYESAFDIAFCNVCNDFDETGLNVQQREKWSEMKMYLPDLIALYFEEHDQSEPQIYVEKEWWACLCKHGSKDHLHGGPPGESACLKCNTVCRASLCGRLDRFSAKTWLYELKTASEIGRNWKRDYREGALRDIGLALYDWYLCGLGQPPQQVLMEVLIKPWKNKEGRLEVLELNEIIAYRDRFKQQLNLIIPEMVWYMDKYQDTKPWPMNGGSLCLTKYGPCDYLRLCNHGEANLKYYKSREEHLDLRRNQTQGTTELIRIDEGGTQAGRN